MPFEKKTSLTFEEKIKAAYLHYCKGIEQQTIASDIFDGINIGRVNEACKEVRAAVVPKRKRRLADKRKQLAKPAPRLLLVHRRGG
jgi:hypothetical protein